MSRFALLILPALLASSVARADGADFAAEAQLLYRDVACGGPDAPKNGHCRSLSSSYERYRRKWLEPAMPFLENLVPGDVPKVVVYPFGGGDLLTALATFPDATEYTTISLEPAGDARKIATVNTKDLDAELTRLRANLASLFSVAHSKTTNLGIEWRSALPGQLVFSFAALAIHGYEPVALRYFDIQPDGSLKYLTAEEIAAQETSLGRKSRSAREKEVFANAELTFRKVGDAAAPVKTLRHIAFNLDDKHLAADPSLLRHLEAKGKVAAMTKAASHLLWASSFSTIRQYLLDHMAWMISDSTGVPPRHARAAGFAQDTYGKFMGPATFGTVDKRDGDDLVKLFAHNPRTRLPFRTYGYPDNASNGHIVVTRPAK